MDKDSYYETVYSSATSPYSMTTTNGAVLSNFAGQHIYDANGNQITNFGPEDINQYLFIYQAAIWDTMRSIVVKLICLLK